MRYLLTLLLFSSLIYADECEDLYTQTKESSKQVSALIKSNIASHKAYEIINDYLSLGSSTIAACATSESSQAFRITREVNADMKRILPVKEKFRVQTFNELKEAALVQAKKEAQGTNIYNNTYIQRNSNRPRTQPVSY